MSETSVIFLIPNLIFCAEVEIPISDSSIDEAVAAGQRLAEQLGREPVAFLFKTITVGEDGSASEHLSHKYFWGGRVQTIDEIREANRPSEQILLGNMKRNGYDRIVKIGPNSIPMSSDDTWAETLYSVGNRLKSVGL